MPIQKEHKEFYTVDLAQGWEVPAGYPSGIEQQILAGSLDEKNEDGLSHAAPALPARASTPRCPSCTNTGRKSISSRAI